MTKYALGDALFIRIKNKYAYIAPINKKNICNKNENIHPNVEITYSLKYMD
jgi:hypothetical protein